MLVRVKGEGGRNRDKGGGGLCGVFDVVQVADELKFTTHPPGEIARNIASLEKHY